MTDKEMEKIADEIVKEVSMIPDISEYEAMASCAIRALKWRKQRQRAKLKE